MTVCCAVFAGQADSREESSLIFGLESVDFF